MPSSVRRASAARTVFLLLHIAVGVDYAKAQASFEEAIKVAFILDPLIACSDGHVVRSSPHGF